MEAVNKDKKTKDSQSLLAALDRGIDQMEADRELPLKEAIEKVSELRDIRRRTRE